MNFVYFLQCHIYPSDFLRMDPAPPIILSTIHGVCFSYAGHGGRIEVYTPRVCRPGGMKRHTVVYSTIVSRAFRSLALFRLHEARPLGFPSGFVPALSFLIARA